jgi:hypothetical protein
MLIILKMVDVFFSFFKTIDITYQHQEPLYDKETQLLIDAVEKKYFKTIKPINNRVNVYKDFKDQLMKKLQEICTMFNKLQIDEQPKIKNLPVFAKDA